MKDVFSYIATRVLLISSLILAYACSQIVDDTLVSEGENMTLIATIEDTKTANDGVSTRWSEGDMANLIHCQSGHTTYYASCFSYGSDGKFSGNVSNKSNLNDWYFSYPYSSTNLTPDKINVNVNPTPVQIGNNSTDHLCGATFPIFGVCKGVPSSETLDLSVKNSLAVGKVIVTNTFVPRHRKLNSDCHRKLNS